MGKPGGRHGPSSLDRRRRQSYPNRPVGNERGDWSVFLPGEATDVDRCESSHQVVSFGRAEQGRFREHSGLDEPALDLLILLWRHPITLPFGKGCGRIDVAVRRRDDVTARSAASTRSSAACAGLL